MPALEAEISRPVSNPSAHQRCQWLIGFGSRWLTRPGLWCAVLVAAYLVFFAALTLNMHAAFATSALDLGIYDQIIWNTAHGRVLAYSAEPRHGSNFLATHIQPILILLAPLYWVWSDAQLLILLQSLAIAASALPVYLLASWRLGSKWLALIVVLAYLLFPALQAVNVFVFHPESFEPFLLLMAFALFEISRRRLAVHRLLPRLASALMWLALFLALGVKEDVALVLIALGLYWLIVHRERRLAFILIGVASLWFTLSVFVVTPSFRDGKPSPFLEYYGYLGETPQEIARTILTRPGLVVSFLLRPANGTMLLSFLLPFGFLPLLESRLLMVAIPPLLVNGLSQKPFMQRMEQFQYAAPIIPFVALALIYGLGHLRMRPRGDRWLKAALGFMIACSVGYQILRGFTPLSRLFAWPISGEHQRVGRMLMQQIPADASLVAQDMLYPHLSQREQILFYWPADASMEYVFLDVAHPRFTNGGNVHAWLREEITRRQDYGVIAGQDGFLLLRRGATPQPLPEEFYTFVRVQNPAIRWCLEADFEDGIRFLGYDVFAERDAEVQLALYWTALHQPARDYFLSLYLLDIEGKILDRVALQQPTLVWYPTSRWQPGETVRVLANTITWSTESLDRFAVGLALSATDDVSKGELRLAIRPVPGEQTLHLLERDTILWLGEFRRQLGATWLVKY